MPIVIILLLAVLVASFGFWDTLSAIFGAVALLVVVGLIVAAIAVLGAMSFIRKRGKS